MCWIPCDPGWFGVNKLEGFPVVELASGDVFKLSRVRKEEIGTIGDAVEDPQSRRIGGFAKSTPRLQAPLMPVC